MQTLCVIIQQERLPTKDYEQFRKSLSWSYHQFNLLLQTLIGHQSDLTVPLNVLCVPEKELKNVYRTLAKTFSSACTDYVSDPVYDCMNHHMSAAFGHLDIISTYTLLDWRLPENQSVLKKYYTKAKPFSKLTPLKEQLRLAGSRAGVLSPNLPRSGQQVELPAEVHRYIMDLQQELLKTQQDMAELGMRVHRFGHIQQKSFEQQLLDYARHSISLVDSDSWYKPDTAIGINWDCESTGSYNSTQLSPFFSIGSLSPKFYWETLETDQTKMGSARDQILFRECFNATAIAAALGLSPRTDEFWSDSDTSKFIDPKAKDFPWERDPDTIMSWQQGTMDPEGRDANQSMRELWKNGWLHHLRRHLVADVLTRGKLHQHWTEGMYWFRYTLLDHDSAVNRANWMWLAAVAFSSKQKVYHYGWKDYVQRGTPKSISLTTRPYITLDKAR